MKKYFLISVICICTNCFSQTLFNYGLKIGYNNSNQNWNYSDSFIKMEWDNYSGMNIKGFVSYSASSYFELESEIGYSQKGVQADIPYSTFENPEGNGKLIKVTRKFNYLTTSLLGKIKYNISLFTPYALTGLEYNNLMNINSSDIMRTKNDYKNTLGFTFGGGTEINLSFFDLLIEYRYSKDLTPTLNGEFLKIKNYSHSISAGIKI